MREAIGGSWILSIVVVFIFLFLFFLTYSINYTRAFNVKNEIINYIEHSEGYTKYSDDNNLDIESVDLSSDKLQESVQGKSYVLIKRTGYDYDGISVSDCTRQDVNAKLFSEGGYCIVKVCQDSDNNVKNTYYKVTTFISMKLPILGLGMNIPVSGQTRTIYQDKSGYSCDY